MKNDSKKAESRAHMEALVTQFKPKCVRKKGRPALHYTKQFIVFKCHENGLEYRFETLVNKIRQKEAREDGVGKEESK